MSKITSAKKLIVNALNKSTKLTVVKSGVLEFHYSLELSNGAEILIDLNDFTVFYMFYGKTTLMAEFSNGTDFITNCELFNGNSGKLKGHK